MGHRDYKTTLIYADYAPIAHERELVERAFGADGATMGDADATTSNPGEEVTEVSDNWVGARAALFTAAPVDDDELLARQGITAPQGLEALSDPEWDDDTDDAYLAALLSK